MTSAGRFAVILTIWVFISGVENEIENTRKKHHLGKFSRIRVKRFVKILKIKKQTNLIFVARTQNLENFWEIVSVTKNSRQSKFAN
jgi:hypothetical protein